MFARRVAVVGFNEILARIGDPASAILEGAFHAVPGYVHTNRL
jgi:hypothetical protein